LLLVFTGFNLMMKSREKKLATPARTRIRAISKQMQKAVDNKQSLDNTIITPEPVTTLLQEHIMSTLCKIEPILLELHLAVGSEMRVKLSLFRA